MGLFNVCTHSRWEDPWLLPGLTGTTEGAHEVIDCNRRAGYEQDCEDDDDQQGDVRFQARGQVERTSELRGERTVHDSCKAEADHEQDHGHDDSSNECGYTVNHESKHLLI